MDRRDRERYNYGPYQGYDRNDEHYHSAINLTNQFERDYQSEHGRWNGDRSNMRHSYHEGDMGGAYERYSNRRHDYQGYDNNQPGGWNRDRSDFGDYTRASDSYSNHGDNYMRSKEMYGRNRGYGNRDPYTAYNQQEYSRGGDRQDLYPGSGGDDRRYGNEGSRSGSNAGDIWGSPDRRQYQLDRYY